MMKHDKNAWVVLAAVLTLTVALLHFQGRQWWCSCGGSSLWAGNIWSSHCSQHFLDPYSFTHMLHGLLLYAILALACPKIPLHWRLCLAVSLEAGWEVFENSNFTIERYRAVTMALDYCGDTIANSLGDITCCTVGFLLAWRFNVWYSIGLFVATEALLLFCCHDSLLLNVLMLTWPIDAIKTWQMTH